MGFLDSIRLWLERLFQGKPKQAETSALPFETIPSWIEQQTDSEFKGLETESLNRFSEIRFLLKEIRNQLIALEKKKIESEEENQNRNERLQRVVSSSQQTMVLRMRILLDKLEPPKMPEWEEMRAYATGSFGLLQKETGLFGKNIAYTSLLHKEEVKSIGQHLSELETILKSLSNSFSSNPLFEQTNLAKNLHSQVFRLMQEQQRLEQESSRLHAEQKQFQQFLSRQQTGLAEMQSSLEAKQWEKIREQLTGLANQKEKLRSQLSELVSGIDKPLKRFQQLVSSNQWALEKEPAQFLSALSESPLKALEADPKGQSFKSILKEILSAIDQKKIAFRDEKEEAKRRSAVLHLLEYDFFSNFFWKQNELEKKRQQAEKQLHASEWSQRFEAQKKQLQKTLFEKEESEKALHHSQIALQKNRLLFEEKKSLLEKQLSGIASEAVTISFSDAS